MNTRKTILLILSVIFSLSVFVQTAYQRQPILGRDMDNNKSEAITAPLL